MGKVEKLVVLGVLFVISVILAVSLNQSEPLERRPSRSEPSEPAATPLERPAADARADRQASLSSPSPATASPTDRRASRTDPPAQRAVEATAPREEEPRVLTSSVRPVVPDDWDLVSLDGLDEPGAGADTFRVYTCRAGDTFESLAARFYGDESRAELLRRNNEGLGVLAPGRDILVPVRDDAGPTAREHVVEDGESLWIISRRFYGKGSRWEEIYEANRDVLSSADAVQVGMRLRIP